MAEHTKIEWAHHTFNPWLGCTAISAACDHCYAEAWAKRFGEPELWAGTRRRTSAANWAQPLTWNRRAKAEGRRYRVFCASLADVFDNQVPVSWRDDLWALIERTPHLDWLLLTKRPQNIAKMLPPGERWGDGWPHVWLGTTVETQKEAERRIPQLLSVPARLRFLSCEPLLGPVDLTAIPRTRTVGFMRPLDGRFNRIDWVIAGGESGQHARPMHPDWARSLRDQCATAGTAFFFKQWGEYRPAPEEELPEEWGAVCDDFAVVCSNGFVGPFSLESAFLHKPDRYPGCFPNGPAGDCSCSVLTMRRVGKKAAGNSLDGRQHLAWPELAT